MAQIKWQDFEKVDLRVGTIVNAAEFPEARRPAYKLEVDCGDDIGRRRASAQITDLYQPDDLIGKQVLGVVNFPPKQIGPFMSQCLITGFVQDGGEVILAVPDRPARNGDRLA
jgi:tRNA-binding protein